MVGRKEHDTITGTQSAEDLRATCRLLADLHRPHGRSVAGDHVHGPVLPVPEQRTDRHDHGAGLFPDDDACLDAVAVAQPGGPSWSIDDHVDPLFLDTQRGQSGERRRLDVPHVSSELLAVSPPIQDDGAARPNASRIRRQDIDDDLQRIRVA